MCGCTPAGAAILSLDINKDGRVSPSTRDIRRLNSNLVVDRPAGCPVDVGGPRQHHYVIAGKRANRSQPPPQITYQAGPRLAMRTSSASRSVGSAAAARWPTSARRRSGRSMTPRAEKFNAARQRTSAAERTLRSRRSGPSAGVQTEGAGGYMRGLYARCSHSRRRGGWFAAGVLPPAPPTPAVRDRSQCELLQPQPQLGRACTPPCRHYATA